MKSVHTQPSSRNLNVIHDKFEIPQRILQDMSVCDISVDTELDTNKELLSAMKMQSLDTWNMRAVHKGHSVAQWAAFVSDPLSIFIQPKSIRVENSLLL